MYIEVWFEFMENICLEILLQCVRSSILRHVKFPVESLKSYGADNTFATVVIHYTQSQGELTIGVFQSHEVLEF